MRVVDEAQKKLAATLKAETAEFMTGLTQQREALIAGLQDVSTKSLQDLDKILSDNLRDALEGIRKEEYAARASAENVILGLQASLQRVVVFFAAMTFLALLMWSVYRELAGSRDWSVVWKRAAVAAAVCILCWLSSGPLINLYLRHSFEDLEQKWVTAYNASLTINDYQHAIYWAEGLKELDPNSDNYQGMHEKATLLRDVFLRPSIYKSALGINEVDTRISRAQKLFKQAKQKPDRDLDVIRALVMWQGGTERFTEYVAASECASALERSTGDNSPFPTKPIATFYLESYLANPLSNDELKLLGFDIKQQNSSQSKQDGFRYMTVTELRQVLVTNPQTESETFAANIQFGKLARSAYRRAISTYLQLAFTEARINAAPEPEKGTLRSKRKQLAQAIVAIWTKFEKDVQTEKLSDIALQSTILRSELGVFGRSAAYLAIDANDTIPPISADDDNSIVSKWLKSSIQPHISDSRTLQTIGIAAKSDFADQETKLKAFEETLTAYFNALKAYGAQATPDVPTITALNFGFQTAAAAASISGLFGCSTDNSSLECVDATTETVPAHQIIRMSLPLEVQVPDVRPEVHRNNADRRVLPVV